MACAVNSAADLRSSQSYRVGPADLGRMKCQHLTAAAAEVFYREKCRSHDVNPNHTFAKQLLAGATIFDFDHGYLGERGIVPILATLERLAVVELSMRDCEIATDDVLLLYKTFASHDTIRKIDLRGIRLSVLSARKLLTLAIENTRVTQILVDEETPKYLCIQKQCFANAHMEIPAALCLVCRKSVIHSAAQHVEGSLLLSLGEGFAETDIATGAMGLHAMFCSILACCEANDGVIFLCSPECRTHLADDILTSMRAIVQRLFSGIKGALPKNPILRRCVTDTIKRLEEDFSPQQREAMFSSGSCVASRRCNLDSGDETADEESEDVLEECTICGGRTVCLPNAAHLLVKQICDDIKSGSLLQASALLCITHAIVGYSGMRACSQDCVVHFVRFGIHGYGGVLQSSGVTGDSYVSLLGIPLMHLPSEDFAILNLSIAYIEDMEGEDTCCALTVASAMSDIDGVTIDPYMMFAMGRHLAKLHHRALGLELRHACDVAVTVGCLPASMGPFDRRKEKPPRSMYVSLEKWAEHTDMDRLMRISFSRRRQGVYVVDGPHNNLFDNARAVLWAFRRQRRAVLVVMRFCVEWLKIPGGVVPNEKPLKKAFLTTLKIVGQVNIDNTFYIICQANFGPRVGNGGFFYIPRSIFNLHVSGSAYIFVDAREYSACKGQKMSLYATPMVPRKVVDLVENTALLQELVYHCGDTLIPKRRHRLDNARIMSEVLRCIPLSMSFLYRACFRGLTQTQSELLATVRQMFVMDGSRSLRLFYFMEVLGPLTLEWVDSLTALLSLLPPHSLMLQTAAECAVLPNLERSQSHLKWNSLVVAKAPIFDAPRRSDKRTSRRPNFRTPNKQLMDGVKDNAMHDVFRASLEQQWATFRGEWESSRGIHQSGFRSSASVGQSPPAKLLNFPTTSPTHMMTAALEADVVPLELVGQPWSAVSLCNADGSVTDYALFFIKDYVCCFNVANQTVIVPLHPVLESAYPCKFPFCTGFDCALNSPVNPRTAYFFCGEHWAEWDTYRQACIGGPYKLQLHRQFEALPLEFSRGIDAAVPLPNTSYVLFFSQLKYLVFDLVHRRIVGDVKRIGSVEPHREGDVPMFSSALSNLFPYGPMATLLMRIADTDENGRMDGERETVNKGKLAVKLIGRDGSVVVAQSFMPSTTSTSSFVHEPFSASNLSRLPLALRQMTVAALSSVCKDVLNAECARCGVVVDGPLDGNRQVDAITSTLTRQGETNNFLSLTRHGVASSSVPLIRNEVVFAQTEESMLDDPPQVIEVDYGSTKPVSFGVLVLVLNTLCIEPRILRLAPIEAVVESSDDGVTYIRHMRFLATPYVTAVCWGEAHVARFWRVRFLTRLPVGTGIVRLLWWEVARMLGTLPLDPTAPLLPRESTEVTINAPRIFCAPKEIFNCFAPGAVFSSCTSNGWFKPHCILPLLPHGEFCLLFCGSNFVELDCKNGVVVSRRAVSLAHHPAFKNLPSPFLGGITAAFYPDLNDPHVVALLHENDIILWNLHLGLCEGSSAEKSSALFEGMPWSMDQVEEILQIWDHPGEVFVIRSPEVLRWSIISAEIIEGPMLLRDCPYLYHLGFEGKPILCATSFPSAPKRFYVFCEDHVAAKTMIDGESSKSVGPKPVSEFDLFAPVMWYLNWGKRRFNCVIHIDFKEEQPLLSGLVMRSSEPCNEEWLIECSDDEVEWSRVGRHRQHSGSSRTMWGLGSVGHRCHRFWRLTTNAPVKRGNDEQPVLYTNLSFFTLFSMTHRVPPQRVSLSGTLNGPISALFLDEGASVAFEMSTDTRDMERLPTHYIALDYGDIDPPDLMGFSCQWSGKRTNAMWSSWCSNDGEQWENCGVWWSCFRGFKASWSPRGPRRYWRLELQSWEPNALCENLCLFEFVGPSLVLQKTLSSFEELDPSLLLEKSLDGYQMSAVKFPVQVGAVIALDAKQNAVNIVGVRIVTHPHQVTSTGFAIECSSNATDWGIVDTTLLLRGGSAQAAWEGNDFCRYWRLRVVQHSGPPLLVLSEVSFQISRPRLYCTVKSAPDVAKTTSILRLNLGWQLKEVVRVQALLPPNSVYAVEKLSLDGYTWEEVARVENNGTMCSRLVSQGWVPQGYSSNWRLRCCAAVCDSEAAEEFAFTPTQEHLDQDLSVEWYTFSGKTLIPSTFTDKATVQVTTAGFVELQDAIRLTDNRSGTVVLRSIDQETHASVSWFFGQNTTPRFHQVVLKGRTAINPDAPLPLTVPVPENPPNAGTGKTKSHWRRGGGGETSSHTTTTTTTSGAAEVIAEEVKAEKEKEVVLTIVVEISDNGIDYVPIAERPFSQEGNALSWRTGTMASYWRIQFKGISTADHLELWEVTWLVEKGIGAVLAPADLWMLSNNMFDRLQAAAFNHEEEFCRMCRNGYDQAKSLASGLREPGDIERHGSVAQRISRLKGEFTAFVAKVSKEAAKDQDIPSDKYISIGRPLSNDVMYLLHRAAKRYNCNVDELNALIAHPMLFGRNLLQVKEGLSWFFPKMEQRGVLVESFYGFHDVYASFSVLWSLSLNVQRDTDVLYNRSMTPLNPHIASVLIVVNVKQNNWLAAENFPGLPLLYHVGFSERPVVIAFVLNELTFTSRYNMSIPERDPFPAVFPFHVLPGVNFIQYMPLTSCPCPIFDRLQLLYSREYLAKHPTEIVFSAPTMQSKTATVCFTLPGAGVDFSVPGLSIESIEFEVQLFMDKDVAGKVSTTKSMMCSMSEEFHRISFVTHNSILDDPYDGSRRSFTLAGCISNSENRITIVGGSPSVRFPTRHTFPGAFITDMKLSFSLVAGETPQSFHEPLFTIDGTLVTPSNGSYLCRFQRASLNRRYESASIQAARLQLVDFIELGYYMVAAPARTEDVNWMRNIPIFLSVELKSNYLPTEFVGRGSIEVAGSQGAVSVTVSVKNIGIEGTLAAIRVGGITLQGNPAEGSVILSTILPPNGSFSLRLEGYSCLLSPQPYPTKVEISQAGVMCVSTGLFYDVCIEEDSYFPSGMYAQVSVSKKVITACLSEMLQKTPLIIALLSKGVPFAFFLEEVLVEECLLDRQLMFLSVRGLLYGSRFDAMISVIRPENTMEEAHRVCHRLIPHIVEQCDGPIWAAYDTFLGCIDRPGILWRTRDKDYDGDDDNDDGGGGGGGGGGNDTATAVNGAHSRVARCLAEEPKGQFLAQWMSFESELLNADMQSVVELALQRNPTCSQGKRDGEQKMGA